MKIAHIIHLVFVALSIFLLEFFILPPAKINAASNCSLNIYPQPTPGTHRYTVTLTNNTSIPGYSFINNYWIDGQPSGNPSNVITSPYNYWSLTTGLGYQVNGSAGIPIVNSTITYEIDITINNMFNGVDVALESQSDSSFDICSQGHETYAITYDNLSLTPTLSPTPANPLSPTPSSCSLNIYPQPTPGTHRYTVTLTNNTSTPGYKFTNNYWVDNQPLGYVSNLETSSGWYVHAPIQYQVTGTVAGVPIANNSITYSTNLTFSNIFNGVDIALQSQGSLNYDICSQGHGAYVITYDNLSTPTPTPTATPTPTPKTPLILIPGVGGSELATAEPFVWNEDDGHGGKYFYNYATNEKVWVNNLMAGLLGDDDYFDILRLNMDGKTSLANLTTIGTLFSGYDNSINFFESIGYTLGKDFFLFPYDWRKDIALTLMPLNDLINTIKTKTGSTKVDITAHSMGGLVARNYISDPAKAQNVRKLFMLGVPYLGSANFLKVLRYGDCLTTPTYQVLPFCLGVAPSEVKDIVQNMISAFELAPTQKYFDFYSGEDADHPHPFNDAGDIDGNGVGPLNYDQTKTLLNKLGHNTQLFYSSEAFHKLDDNLTNTNGVEIYNIVGSGMPTLGQIIEKYTTNIFGEKVSHKDQTFINGDETVPLMSASLTDYGKSLSLLGDAKVYYTKQEHGNLAVSGPALLLVKNILNNDNTFPDGVSVVPYSFRGTIVSGHSPINLNVYDSSNNHTGINSDGDIEANIQGSFYDTLDDAKFIYLPNDGIYSIKIAATDQGSFDLEIRKFENNENTGTTLYENVPLIVGTKVEATLDTSLNTPPILRLDEDGDGIFERDINAGDVQAPTPTPTSSPSVGSSPTISSSSSSNQNSQNQPTMASIVNPVAFLGIKNPSMKNKKDAISNLMEVAGVKTFKPIVSSNKTGNKTQKKLTIAIFLISSLVIVLGLLKFNELRKKLFLKNLLKKFPKQKR